MAKENEMSIDELIDLLKSEIERDKEFGSENPSDKSWGYQEGILLSRLEAQHILGRLYIYERYRKSKNNKGHASSS